MRILGWICIVLGIVLGVLFILAKIGGGDISLRAFFSVPVLIFVGWRLKTYSKALVRRPAASTSTATATPLSVTSAAAATSSSPTIELSLSPAVAGIIRSAALRSGRLFAIIGGAFVVLFLAIGAVMDFSTSHSLSLHALSALPIMGLIALACAALLGVIWLLSVWRPASRDLREATYLRSSGPVQVVSMMNGFIVRLADRSFSSGRSPATLCLAKLNWAIVDYSRHVHVIFGVWDQNGTNVYRVSDYRPDPPPVTART